MWNKWKESKFKASSLWLFSRIVCERVKNFWCQKGEFFVLRSTLSFPFNDLFLCVLQTYIFEALFQYCDENSPIPYSTLFTLESFKVIFSFFFDFSHFFLCFFPTSHAIQYSTVGEKWTSEFSHNTEWKFSSQP